MDREQPPRAGGGGGGNEVGIFLQFVGGFGWGGCEGSLRLEFSFKFLLWWARRQEVCLILVLTRRVDNNWKHACQSV